MLGAVLVALCVGCGGGGGAGPAAEGPDEDAHGPAVEAYTESVVTHRHLLSAGDVAVSTLPPLTVHEDVVVTAVTLGATTGSVELVGARLSTGAPGARCAAAVSTAGTTEAVGARVAAGETPSLVLHLRGTRGVVSEVVVRYTTDEGETELRWNALRLELAPRPPSAPRCAGG